MVDSHHTLALPASSKGIKFGHSWAIGYNIAVYGTQKKNDPKLSKNQTSVCHDVKWASIMNDSPFMRRLASESHKVFLLVQDESSKNPTINQ